MKARIWVILCAAAAFQVASAGPYDPAVFERVFPSEYSDTLRNARLAYDAKRYEEAFRLFHRTACAGDKQSQSAIGRMYLLGQGVARDDLTGYAWLKVAAEIIFPGYQKIVQQMEAAMRPEQRRIADAEAARISDLYGLAATSISCAKNASRGGHIIDEIVCAPRDEGNQLLLRRCADETAQ